MATVPWQRMEVHGADADVRRGDEAIPYGRGGMPLEEVAALTGSINCEIPCLLTNRVQKIYL